MKHVNIVKLKEVIREENKLYFVFEYMKENLYQMIKGRYDNSQFGGIKVLQINKKFAVELYAPIMYVVVQYCLCFIHQTALHA